MQCGRSMPMPSSKANQLGRTGFHTPSSFVSWVSDRAEVQMEECGLFLAEKPDGGGVSDTVKNGRYHPGFQRCTEFECRSAGDGGRGIEDYKGAAAVPSRKKDQEIHQSWRFWLLVSQVGAKSAFAAHKWAFRLRLVPHCSSLPDLQCI